MGRQNSSMRQEGRADQCREEARMKSQRIRKAWCAYRRPVRDSSVD